MFLKPRNVTIIKCRWLSGKQRWNQEERKRSATDRALESFDDFYGSVYGNKWKNMRVALLTEHKYVALVNNFGDSEKTCSNLEMDGAINIRQIVNLAKERIQSNENSYKAHQSGFDTKLKAITHKQQEREIAKLYPASKEGNWLADKLDFEDNRKIESVDNRKSLEQAMEEDSCIDTTRLAGLEFGSGGLYEYMPSNRIKGMEDWIPESEHYKYYQTNTDFPLKVVPQSDISVPEHLNVYTYEMGNCSEYQPPVRCLTGVLSYFLMDGASMLPPLLLNVQKGERVLDACAAPGGKSLLLLQTLYPDTLVCNDVQESRINRLRRVMQDYLFDFKDRWVGKRLLLSQSDARNLAEYETYDKILVDVPCTTDRHSLMECDNNIFKPTRIKERLRIPELQAGILTNCIRLLRPGGSLVYSTCSLSPVQNDGVVHMSLQRAFNEFGITATISDMSGTIQLFRDVFKFEPAKNLKYGQMVIPYLPANFGPMYLSKITRDE